MIFSSRKADHKVILFLFRFSLLYRLVSILSPFILLIEKLMHYPFSYLALLIFSFHPPFLSYPLPLFLPPPHPNPTILHPSSLLLFFPSPVSLSSLPFSCLPLSLPIPPLRPRSLLSPSSPLLTPCPHYRLPPPLSLPAPPPPSTTLYPTPSTRSPRKSQSA